MRVSLMLAVLLSGCAMHELDAPVTDSGPLLDASADLGTDSNITLEDIGTEIDSNVVNDDMGANTDLGTAVSDAGVDLGHEEDADSGPVDSGPVDMGIDFSTGCAEYCRGATPECDVELRVCAVVCDRDELCNITTSDGDGGHTTTNTRFCYLGGGRGVCRARSDAG